MKTLKSKKKKADPNQLLLSLTFANPSAAVLRQLALLVEVADTSVVCEEKGGNRKAVDIRNDVGSDWDLASADNPELAAKRKYLRRLVGCIALTYSRQWEEVWVPAYHHFNKRHNFHPIASASQNKRKIHLDELFTIRGLRLNYPDKLRVILEAMVIDFLNPFPTNK